jgi:hypothetical protein
MRWTSLTTLLVLGCADAELTLPAGQAPLPQPMSLTVTTPLSQGSPFDLRVSGARPGAAVKIIRSDGGIGGGGCPPVLGGQCLDIRPGNSGYSVLLDLVADPSGVATFSGVLPQRVAGGALLSFQAVDPVNDTGSNPVVRTVQSACADDTREDDDNFILATQLTSGAWLPSQACPGDGDWFYADLQPGQVLEVAADFDPRAVNLDLQLLDGASTVLQDSTFVATAPERLSFVAPTAGRYYAAAWPQRTGAAGAPYTLTANIATPQSCSPDAQEPNNDGVRQARAIGTGTWTGLTTCTTNDYDWFRVALTAGQTVNVDVLFANDEGDIDAWLLPAASANDIDLFNADALARGVTADNDEQLSWTTGSTTSVWLVVRMYRDQGASRVGNRYDLAVDVH